MDLRTEVLPKLGFDDAVVVAHDEVLGGVVQVSVDRSRALELRARYVGRPAPDVVRGHGEDVRVAHELRDELVVRLAVDVLGRPRLDGVAVVQHEQLVAHHQRGLEAVGNVDERHVQLDVEIGEFALEALLQDVVQRGERLVEQQDVGVVRQRAGQRDALLLPAGELRRLLVGVHVGVESHLFEQFLDLAVDLAAGGLDGELDVLANGHVGNSAHDWNTRLVGRSCGDV
ncbi:hypothetical protein VB779_19040 [Haloarculaceae archaeon H-GB11]|nr:hypothetical protein [Haloarculaceae archaeon H-GB11]